MQASLAVCSQTGKLHRPGVEPKPRSARASAVLQEGLSTNGNAPEIRALASFLA